MSKTACVILAAGKGTRMKSRKPKVLHPLAGRPMIEHVIASVESLAPEHVVLVVSAELEGIAETLDCRGLKVSTAVQEPQLGTAHAVSMSRPLLQDFDGDVVVLYADTPLVRGETLMRLVATRRETPGAVAAVLGFRPDDPAEYGRLIVTPDGTLTRIVEYTEATDAERAVDICNAGMMAIDGRHLFSLIDAIGNENAQAEYYLTDVPAVAAEHDQICAVAEAPTEEVMGINDRAQLAAAEHVVQRRLRERVMAEGATLIDPSTTWLSFDTRIGQDVVIGPNVFLGTGVVIEDEAEIKAFCHFENVHIGKSAEIGPFARMRPGTKIGEGARVGNFVEMKNTTIEPGAKVNHLSYVGDTRVGSKANVGAGTITCNYDGYTKSRTDIGEGAFIGSNSSLVAPVTIGDGAVIGAGSVITEDVEADAIAVTRSEQQQRKGAAARRRARRQRGQAAE
jgi:bifunctional UDP-N-acetylglucosamine pyrophosphorylase/glucosamine-1-phosphate N-acetyltransferase